MGHYEGDIVNGKRDGLGRIIYPDRSMYDGEWKNDKRHGMGRWLHIDLQWQEGTIYDGQWENDAWNGEGEMVSLKKINAYPISDIQNNEFIDWDYASLLKKYEEEIEVPVISSFFGPRYGVYSIYVGEFKDGKRQGKGKVIYPCLNRTAKNTLIAIYDGSWKNNEKDGNGKARWIYKTKDRPDVIETYEGEYKKDLKVGHGVFTYDNGDVYEGNWKNNEIEGNGKMTRSTGEIFDGEWQDGEFVEGKVTYPNGDVYEGQWNEDKKHGRGKMMYANGEIFEGNWRNDKRDGLGEMTYENSIVKRVTGNWKKDKLSSVGLDIEYDKERQESMGETEFLREQIQSFDILPNIEHRYIPVLGKKTKRAELKSVIQRRRGGKKYTRSKRAKILISR